MTDAAITIADLDNPGATNTVAPEAPAGGPPPAAESAPAESVSAPTEPQGSGEPAEPKDKPQDGEPEWFKKRLSDFSRQRRSAERRAEQAEARAEQLLRQLNQQPTPVKSQELRPQDFQDYSAFVAAVAAQAGEQAAVKATQAATQATVEQQSQQALQRSYESFVEKATAQAVEAGIDFEAVEETLRMQPLLSPTVMNHLAESEIAAKLAEYLAVNPNDLHRVSMMGPALAKRELAKIEAGLKPAPSKPNATKAPPIGPTVGGRGVTQKSESDMDMDEFAAHFMAKEEARLKRM